MMVFSASFPSAFYDLQGETGGNGAWFFLRQLLFALLGVGAMAFCSLIPLRVYERLALPALPGALLLLALVPVVGVKVNGARRWISLGITTFQPSELAKLAVILFFSAQISRTGEQMSTFRQGILPYALILLLITGLLVLEPHFSATVIILSVGAVLLFAGGARLGWFVGGGTLLVSGGTLAYFAFPYVAERLRAWRDPFSDLTGDGWQVVQSLYAIGSGGLSGLGLGRSRQKYLYLPEEHNDFIFAVLCEELGFLGALVVLCLFALLIIRGFRTALGCSDRFGFLLGVGISSLLALQTILNIAVCTNLLPCTGIALPFFSYGGTALLIQLAEMGILLSVSRENPGDPL
ncbi:MAG: putative lipid II flippase FtsW [Clostridiales bacterium]|nr:putative lipid II flippase FtsW [Candidatus Apopatocola equi]